MNIQYFCEETDFLPPKQEALSLWISNIVSAHKYTIQEINYIFTSDEYLLKVNQEHLQHDYFTDIITFDNSEEETVIESDIFISIDRVKENAKDQNIEFHQELHRVMIHGILHLLGLGDKTEQEQKHMREKEDACLSLLKI